MKKEDFVSGFSRMAERIYDFFVLKASVDKKDFNAIDTHNKAVYEFMGKVYDYIEKLGDAACIKDSDIVFPQYMSPYFWSNYRLSTTRVNPSINDDSFFYHAVEATRWYADLSKKHGVPAHNYIDYALNNFTKMICKFCNRIPEFEKIKSIVKQS